MNSYFRKTGSSIQVTEKWLSVEPKTDSIKPAEQAPFSSAKNAKQSAIRV